MRIEKDDVAREEVIRFCAMYTDVPAPGAAKAAGTKLAEIPAGNPLPRA